MCCRGFLNGAMLLLVQRTRVLDISCQTRFFLKLVTEICVDSFFTFLRRIVLQFVRFMSTYFVFTYFKAKQMPVTTSKLRRLLKSKLPYVERNLDTIVSIVRHSMQNSFYFEAAAQQLKEGRLATVSIMI